MGRPATGAVGGADIASLSGQSTRTFGFFAIDELSSHTNGTPRLGA